MPELRIVVLATQDRMAYGASFEEALEGLLEGTAASSLSIEDLTEMEPGTQPAPTAVGDTRDRLIARASQAFEAYQQLTAEGKLADAGQALEELKATLAALSGLGQ